MKSKKNNKYNFAKLIEKGFENETAKPILEPAILRAASRNASSSSNYSLERWVIRPVKKVVKASESIFDIKKEEPDEE
jgi:hypothetical protein